VLRLQARVSFVNGIARFVDAQHYAASFGFQWHRYQKTQLDHDDVREADLQFPDEDALRPEDLKGKLVLDVGCGMGRFAELPRRGARGWSHRSERGGGSGSEEPGGSRVRGLPGDVFALPFAPDSFDLIYSMECFITHRIVKRR